MLSKPFLCFIKLIFKKAGREADPEIIEKLRVRKRELFLKMKNIAPFDSMYDLLKKLKSHFHLAVVSGSDRPIVDSMINEFYPDIFEVTISGADVTNGKPDPEPYLKVVEELSLNPENCLAIEDSLVGIQSTKTAGCLCFGLRKPYNKHLDFAIAELVIHDLFEVKLLPLKIHEIECF